MERTEIVTLANMCMIYDDRGNVLVQEKVGVDYKGLLFPGGHIEKHEPVVDSVIREIKEETGLSISNLEFCGVKDWIEENGMRYLVFLFKTNVFSGELSSTREGEVFWMPLTELKKKEVLWHLDKMIEIFTKDHINELYFTSENWETVLK